MAGLYQLWQAVRRTDFRPPTSAFVGAILMGWGFFNVVEGLVNHHLLGIHHVRAGENQLGWDLAFLAWGAAMLLSGWWLTQKRAALSPVANR